MNLTIFVSGIWVGKYVYIVVNSILSSFFSLYKIRPTILGKKQERVYGQAVDVKEILQNEGNYQNVRGQFFKLLDTSFNNTFKYLERFQNMRLQYAEDLRIDVAALKKCRGIFYLNPYFFLLVFCKVVQNTRMSFHLRNTKYIHICK